MALTVLDELLVFWKASFVFIDPVLGELSTLDILEDSLCLLYTSPSPRDVEESRMPSSA